MAFRKKTGEPIEAPEPQEQKETSMPKREEKEMVVMELPQLPTKKIVGDDGNIYNLTTLTEAVQEILENTREIIKLAKEE